MELLVVDAVEGAALCVLRRAAGLRRSPTLPDDTPTLPIKKVGVIGAGTMGGGISMNFLNAGIPVTIVETAQDSARPRPRRSSASNYENTAKKGRLTHGGCRDAHGAAHADARSSTRSPIAISSSRRCSRTWTIKKEIFAQARHDRQAGRDPRLQHVLSRRRRDRLRRPSRPEHVLGMHFFSPANVMRLLEVVRGAKTAKPVIATVDAARARRSARSASLVGVCYGFVGNRMLAAAPARGAEADPRRRDALGRRPRASTISACRWVRSR